MDAYLRALGTGKLHPFASWEQAGVPQVAAGVYTIWEQAETAKGSKEPPPLRFVYVGYSGRDLTEERIAALRKQGARKKALWSRLHAHASGRRSGDQFAIYVADRLVLPTLLEVQIQTVANRPHYMDELVKQYISAHLAFRWVETPDGATAIEVEKQIQLGDWAHGQPLLNPRRPAK